MKSFYKLLSQIRNYRPQVAASIIANILTAVFTVVSIPLIIPFFQILFNTSLVPLDEPTTVDEGVIGELKDYFKIIIAEHGREYALVLICVVIVLVFFFKNCFRYLALFFMAPVRNGIVKSLRSDLFTHYLNLPLSYHSDERKGDLISRITGDVQEVEWSILNVIEAFFKSPFIIIGSIAFMIYISPSLTVFVFVLLLFTAFIIGSISRVLKRKSQVVQENLGMLNTVVEESLTGLKVIKSFNAEDHQYRKFDNYNSRYERGLTSLLRRRDMSSPLSEFLGISVVTILLWFGSRQVFDMQLSADTFFAFVFAFYQVIEPAKAFSNAYFNVQKGLAALERIHSITDEKTELLDTQSTKSLSFQDSIVFEDVFFEYEDNQEVIRNLSLTIKKGEVVALVGASGSGKSTIANLLPRFYELKAGTISIDGVDIREAPLSELRNFFGVVTQDTILFHESIEDNIRFGNQEYSNEELISAAKAAYAHEFICDTEKGYDTIIGDQGLKLSGGQRQRLAIARAILRNPAIFILDEATSALDTESEEIVQKALENIMKSSTAIVVAHRLSTIRSADRIYVLDAGQVLEEGTHDELLSQKAAYYNLVKKQKL